MMLTVLAIFLALRFVWLLDHQARDDLQFRP